MEFSGRRFELIKASDLLRDDMGLEADEIIPDGTRKTVLEAFWWDSDGRITFTTFEHDLSYALIEAFVAKVKPALTLRPDEESKA